VQQPWQRIFIRLASGIGYFKGIAIFAGGMIAGISINQLRCDVQIVYRALIFLALLLPAISWTVEESGQPDPLFQSNEIFDVRLIAPLTTLVKDRPTDEDLQGIFQFTESDNTVVDFDVQIRTRGHFRHDTCDFPPLWLSFEKSQTKDTLFDKQDRLKLVVHCDDSDRYEQTVLREYLAYRYFNVVTDQSFRVRLLRVTYVDTDDRRDEQTRYAFLIEHKNRVGIRLERKDLKLDRTTVNAIQADQLNLTSIFELFLGNTDFSPVAGAPGNECCHNYVLFGNDVDPLLSIPYDFDQSGIVNAPYAVTNENLGIRSVRQRLYRGRCANNEHVPTSLQAFQDNRDAIYKLVEDQEGLESRTRKIIVSYIDDFYELIEDPRDVERKILKKCL